MIILKYKLPDTLNILYDVDELYPISWFELNLILLIRAVATNIASNLSLFEKWKNWNNSKNDPWFRTLHFTHYFPVYKFFSTQPAVIELYRMHKQLQCKSNRMFHRRNQNKHKYCYTSINKLAPEVVICYARIKQFQISLSALILSTRPDFWNLLSSQCLCDFKRYAILIFPCEHFID